MQGGRLIALALVAGLVVAAVPARADEELVDVDAVLDEVDRQLRGVTLPPPPASIGSCTSLVDSYGNAALSDTFAGRDIVMLAAGHQRDEMNPLLRTVMDGTDLSAALELDDMLVRAVRAINDTTQGFSRAIVVTSGGAGNAAEATLTGAIAATSVLLVAIPAEGLLLAPWAGETFLGAFQPLVAYSMATGSTSLWLADPVGHLTYVGTYPATYATQLLRASPPPTGPLNAGLGAAVQELGGAVDEAELIGGAMVDGVDTAVGAAGSIFQMQPPSIGGGDGALAWAARLQGSAGTMAGWATSDAELLSAYAGAASASALARAQMLPGDVAGCPRLGL